MRPRSSASRTSVLEQPKLHVPSAGTCQDDPAGTNPDTEHEYEVFPDNLSLLRGTSSFITGENTARATCPFPQQIPQFNSDNNIGMELMSRDITEYDIVEPTLFSNPRTMEVDQCQQYPMDSAGVEAEACHMAQLPLSAAILGS